ncbi:MAG: cation transporter [Spirochaetales bacterium]|nr:cation transporter [Spirochaetales bacterium]
MEKEQDSPVKQRSRIIMRTSIIGIVANLLLSGFKALVGVLSNSIAIILDAVNNLSDALSSIITIAGVWFSSKKPDSNHPLGHGRLEYISAMVVAFLVLYAGATAAIASVKKIIHPEPATYSVLTLVVMGSAIVVKIILGTFFKKQGKKVNSSALVASGTDASFDAILSLSVLLSALVFMFFGLSLEAYVGVVISVFIIRAGIEILRDTLDDILGKRADSELSKKINEIACSEPGVTGAYDLFVNNYGPDRNYASLHIELPDTMTVEEVDVITRRIQEKVYRETGVVLTGVGVYSYNTRNEEAARIRNDVQEMVMEHGWVLQMHGFFVDIEAKTMRFDVVLSFEREPHVCVDELMSEVRGAFPDFDIQITPDVDLTD